MPSLQNKLLQSALAPRMKELGFMKTGATWRKNYRQATGVVNIQGSQWGPSFYINLGVYFHALGDLKKPTENKCHIRCRLSNLVADSAQLDRLLNFEHPIADETRGFEIERALVTHGIRWLDACSNPSVAAEYIHTVSAQRVMITKDARDFLGTSAA